jgi:V/A-type H+-transporting ATPase subunit F
MRVLVIADHATCLAFSLGGITTRSVKMPEDAAAALNFAIQNQEIGLVLITEKIAASIRPEVNRVIYRLHRPLIVEIPDTGGPLPDRPSAGELMVSLMGY